MRALALATTMTFLAIGALSPAPALAEPTTTEIGAQAKGMAKAKIRDCSRIAAGRTSYLARERRRFCRMGQG